MEFRTKDAKYGQEKQTLFSGFEINTTNNSQTNTFDRDLSATLLDQDMIPTFTTQVQHISQDSLSYSDALSKKPQMQHISQDNLSNHDALSNKTQTQVQHISQDNLSNHDALSNKTQTQVQHISQANLSNNDALSKKNLTQEKKETNNTQTKGKKKKHKEDTLESEVYQCKVCSKEFLSKSGAKFHEKYQHIEAKLYCLVCKKPFKFHFDLDRHMKTHTGHRPFECHDCDKTFVCKSSLMQHVRLKHTVGNIFFCSVCDKSFCTEADLTRHEAVHSDNKPFKCDKCTKTFTCKSSLNVHKKTHSGKKYACEFCNMHFHMQTDLQRHVTIHTGERPWRCKLCRKGYSCKSTLTVHIKNTHTKHPTPDMYIRKKPGEGGDESNGNEEKDDSSSSEEEDESYFDKKFVIEVENDGDGSEIDDYSKMDMDAETSEDRINNLINGLTKKKSGNVKTCKQNKGVLTKGKSKLSKTGDSRSKTVLYSGGTNSGEKTQIQTHTVKFSALNSARMVAKSTEVTEPAEQDIENDNIEHSDDPYKSIDKVNKEIRKSDEILPVSTNQSNKRRRKAKFVRKMEISDGIVILQNP